MKIVNIASIIIILLANVHSQKPLLAQNSVKKGLYSLQGRLQFKTYEQRINPFDMDVRNDEPRLGHPPFSAQNEQNSQEQPHIQQKGGNRKHDMSLSVGNPYHSNDIDEKFNPENRQNQPYFHSAPSWNQDKEIHPTQNIHHSHVQQPKHIQKQKRQKENKEKENFAATVFNFVLDLIGKKIQHTLQKQDKTSSHIPEEKPTVSDPLPAKKEKEAEKDLVPLSAKTQENTETLAAHQLKHPEQVKNSHKKERRKYFVIGTLIFGMMALGFIKMYKKKEEESEQYHRCGVSVPLQQIQI